MSDVLRLRDEKLEWREIDGEVVALDGQQSEYLGVNRAGAALWPLLAGGTTREVLIDQLAQQFRNRARARGFGCRRVSRLACGTRVVSRMSVQSLPAKVRAAWWTFGAIRLVRRQLADGGVAALSLAPPDLPYEGKGGVRFALRLGTRNCLVGAAVRQAWCLAHGRSYDLVIGVKPPAQGFKAHAWLSGDPPGAARGFIELTRRPAAQLER